MSKVRHGFVKDEEWEKIVKAALEISSSEIYIDDSPSLSTTELRIRSRKLKQEKGVGIILIAWPFSFLFSVFL